MTSVNKKYIAINRQSLLIIVTLPENKGQCSIEFKTGFGINREGYFLTNDPVIQKALESDHRYKKSFMLSEIDNVSIHVINSGVKAESIVNTGSDLEEKEFDNVNVAKDFFKSEPYNIPVSKLQTKNNIKEEGKTLGFDVKFKTDNKY